MARLQRLELGARHGDHLLVGGRVVDQRLEIGLLPVGGFSASIVATSGLSVGELLGQLGIGRLIDAGVELGLDRVPALDQLFELVFGNAGHGLGVCAISNGCAARASAGGLCYLDVRANRDTRAAARRI